MVFSVVVKVIVGASLGSGQDIILFRGNDATIRLTVTDDGEAYDLTDCVIDVYFKRKVTEENIDAVIHKQITTGDTSGIVLFYIDGVDTLDLEVGQNFVYDIELTDKDGKEFTLLRDVFKLRQG